MCLEKLQTVVLPTDILTSLFFFFPLSFRRSLLPLMFGIGWTNSYLKAEKQGGLFRCENLHPPYKTRSSPWRDFTKVGM